MAFAVAAEYGGERAVMSTVKLHTDSSPIGLTLRRVLAVIMTAGGVGRIAMPTRHRESLICSQSDSPLSCHARNRAGMGHNRSQQQHDCSR